jgi:uncharacterized damage-inducible protein DinB
MSEAKHESKTAPNPDFNAGAAYLDEARRAFRGYKRMAEGALAQIHDDELYKQIDAESNSVAIILKHIAGNARSRFTDFLTSDGEKPDRHRDDEFIIHEESRDELMKRWEAGWQLVFENIAALRPEDLSRVITIRGQEHTVLQAINRALLHYAYHIGQITFLGKHFRQAEWKSLSIPRGQSETFGREAEKRFAKSKEE